MVNKDAMKAFTLALMLASGGAFAQATPMGLWKVIDEETKQPPSYVRIGDAGGVLSGRMENLLDPVRHIPARHCRGAVLAQTGHRNQNRC